MYRRVLSYMLALTVAWSTWPVPAGWAGEHVEAKEKHSGLAEVVDNAEAARGLIDRTQLDHDAVLDSLNYSEEAILEFVRDQIAYEHYDGVLRGARGTLWSRAGNAPDQAVLLATLLRDAGIDARIRHGRLTTPQARALLERLAEPRGPSPPPADMDRLEALLGRPDGGAEGASSPSGDDDEAAVEHTVRRLLKELDAAGVSLGDPEAEARWLDEMRDYAWVAWRPGPASPWYEAHPAFGDGDGPGEVHADGTWAETVPDALQHRIRVAVYVEQKLGDRLEVHQVVPDWERPVANLIGRSFTISNYPQSMAGDLSELDPDVVLEESKLWIPVFNGRLLPGTRGFDTDGTPFDLESLGMDRIGATAVFREAGDKAESAATALSDLGSEDRAQSRELRTLTAQWVEYTLVEPGGGETVYRRYLYDRLGPAARAGLDFSPLDESLEPRELVASQEFAVAPGRVPESLLLDEFLRLLGGTAKMVMASNKDSDRPLGLPDRDELRALQSALPLLNLLHRFDRELEAQDGTVEYRHEPTLLAFHHALTGRGTARFTVDIVHHARRAFDVSGTDISIAPAAVLRRGVWATRAERAAPELVGLGACPASTYLEAFDTFKAFDTPGAAAVELIRPSDPVPGLPADAGVEFRHGQRAGMAAVLPALLPTETSRVAWWRVDPRTGSTLGVLGNGRGATATEYKIMLTVIALAIPVVLSAPNMWECIKEHRGRQRHGIRASRATFPCCILGKNAKSLNGALLKKWASATHYTLRQLETYGARGCQ